MKRCKNNGMTLIELLIGFFIIASVAVIFFLTMHRFRKETTFNSENFLASSLVEKVLEQCYQESELNLYGMKAIGLTDDAGKPYKISTQIADRETVFFSNPGITSANTPNLHHMVKDNFNLLINSEKKSGFYELTAGFNWTAESGKGQAYSSTRILSYTGEKEVLTSYSMTEAAVKERIVKDIFNSPGGSLESKVSSIGAQDLLIPVGHIYYSCQDWLNSTEFKSRVQKAETLEESSQVGSKDYVKCTKIYFEMARDLLHLMLSLKPHLDAATKNINFLDSIPLPGKFITESRILRGALYFRQLRRIFINCLLKVSERYEQQLEHADSQRNQRLMIGRLFNINRILYVNREFSEEISPNEIVTKVESFLDAMEKSFKEKDPTIFRMTDQERSFISHNKLKANFFTPRLAYELFSEIDKYVVILN